jgi:hypothetical protein
LVADFHCQFEDEATDGYEAESEDAVMVTTIAITIDAKCRETWILVLVLSIPEL